MNKTWAAILLVVVIAGSFGLGSGYLLFKLQDSEHRLAEAGTRTKNIENQLKELQPQRKLMAEIRELAAKVEEIDRKVSTTNSSLASSNQERQAYESQILNLRTQLSRLDTLIQNVSRVLRSELSNLESHVRASDGGISNETKKELSELKNEINNLKKQTTNLERGLENARGQLGLTIPCTPEKVLFKEEFEYWQPFTDKGWVPLGVEGKAGTQAGVVAVGLRALEIQDADPNTAPVYMRLLPRINGTFLVDFYLRAEKYGQSVGLDLIGEGEVPGGGFGRITLELSDNPNNSFRIQDKFFFKYELERWYHVRLIVRTSTQVIDVYVDDMQTPLDRGLRFSATSFMRLLVLTSQAGVGSGYWDNIVIQNCI